MKFTFLPTSAARVRICTSKRQNDSIDDVTRQNISRCVGADRTTISKRIGALHQEWDTERILEANASAIILVATLLGFFVARWIFILCGVIAFFLLVHALIGWCPPLPIIRGLRKRTVYEICAEKMMLKCLRGDFEGLMTQPEKLVQGAIEDAEEAQQMP